MNTNILYACCRLQSTILVIPWPGHGIISISMIRNGITRMVEILHWTYRSQVMLSVFDFHVNFETCCFQLLKKYKKCSKSQFHESELCLIFMYCYHFFSKAVVVIHAKANIVKKKKNRYLLANVGFLYLLMLCDGANEDFWIMNFY